MNKVLIIVTATLALSACFSSEQAEDTARRERREAELRRVQNENTDPNDGGHTNSEPEAPAEPEKVVQYRLLEYGRGLSPGVKCYCREKTECGMTFYGCDDNKVYACIHEVTYSVGETLQTESNSNVCD